MIFDFLLNVNFPNSDEKFTKADELYHYCVLAEKSARTKPDICFLNLGKAMEVLTSCLLSQQNFDDVERISLVDKINLCRSIRSEDKQKFHELRKLRNGVAHYIENSEIGIKNSDLGPVATACKSLVTFYSELRKIFNLKREFVDKKLLPIGDYEVIEKIKAYEFESVEGNYNYICKKTGSDIDSFVYVRPFSSEDDISETVFNLRDIEVQNFFSNMRENSYIIKGTEIQTDKNSELRYLAYDIRSNTKTLDMVSDELEPEVIVDIIYQVAKGLKALSSKKINIHHRGIRPSCIFVTKYDDNEYEAKLGCFETAKIIYVERQMRTVMPHIALSQISNPFIHPLISQRQVVTDEEWEKADVYSLAAVLVYCINKKSISGRKIDYESALEDFEFLYDEMPNIFDSGSLETVPNLNNFIEVLEAQIEDF